MTELAIEPEITSRPGISVELTLDADLLEEAQRQIQAPSPDAAVEEALRRLVDQERAKRRAALERMQRMSDEGVFDYGALPECER